MTFDEYRINYWRMFLLLEKEFVKALDYVELNTNNYTTTSIVFSKLLLSIGTEIDNVFRECSQLSGRTNIEQYYKFIINKYPQIIKQQVKVKDTTIILIPYSEWNGNQPSKSLLFWQKYNELKHDRILNAQNASLENVLNALAGLFILEMYRFDEIYKIQESTFTNTPDGELQSKLFVLSSWEEKIRISKIQLEYSLYDEENEKYDFKIK